jgi:hypothetical protein
MEAKVPAQQVKLLHAYMSDSPLFYLEKTDTYVKLAIPVKLEYYRQIDNGPWALIQEELTEFKIEDNTLLIELYNTRCWVNMDYVTFVPHTPAGELLYGNDV